MLVGVVSKPQLIGMSGIDMGCYRRKPSHKSDGFSSVPRDIASRKWRQSIDCIEIHQFFWHEVYRVTTPDLHQPPLIAHWLNPNLVALEDIPA
jgi:hypothetical protein